MPVVENTYHFPPFLFCFFQLLVYFHGDLFRNITAILDTYIKLYLDMKSWHKKCQ